MSIEFTPVPVRARRDGWAAERQRAFIAALAETRCVVAAARAAGKSWQSAYRLRARTDAASFAVAWDAALAPSVLGPFTGRAVDGVATPIRYRGRQVGERRRYDDRLAKYLLGIRRPERYRDLGDRPSATDPAEAWLDALAEVQAALADDIGPCGGSDFSGDVAQGSSPFAQRRSANPNRCGPAPVMLNSFQHPCATFANCPPRNNWTDSPRSAVDHRPVPP